MDGDWVESYRWLIESISLNQLLDAEEALRLYRQIHAEYTDLERVAVIGRGFSWGLPETGAFILFLWRRGRVLESCPSGSRRFSAQDRAWLTRDRD